MVRRRKQVGLFGFLVETAAVVVGVPLKMAKEKNGKGPLYKGRSRTKRYWWE